MAWIYPVAGGPKLALAVVTVTLFVMNVGIAVSVVTWDGPSDRTYYFVGGREAGTLSLFAVELFIPFVLSHFLTPIFVPRYAVPASIPAFIIVARGLLYIPER